MLRLTPASWIEVLFCDGLYGVVFRLQALLFGHLPVSASEVLLFAAGLGTLGLLARGFARIRRGDLALGDACKRGARLSLAVCSLLYLVFLFTWGFHHGRLPYSTHAGLAPFLAHPLDMGASESSAPDSVAPVSDAELEQLCLFLVEGCNALRPEIDVERLNLDADLDRELAVEAMLHLAEATPIFRGKRPRFRLAMASPILSRLGITGIYSPFTGDAHINADQPAWARPFTACHEMAHQLGIAREGEANFVAWQACMGSRSAELKYSAYMSALGPALGALFRRGDEASVAKGVALFESLSPEVLDDRERAAAWYAEQSGLAGRLSSATNHAYLMSQGQATGVESYGFLVDLLLAERRRDRHLAELASLSNREEPTE